MKDLKQEIDKLDREIQTISIAIKQMVDLLGTLNDRLVDVELLLAEELEMEQNCFEDDDMLMDDEDEEDAKILKNIFKRQEKEEDE
jgi:hypothetical protein